MGSTPSLILRALGDRRFFPRLEGGQIDRIACTDPTADGLHLARWDCRTRRDVVVERAVVGSMHEPTVARTLAAASLPPHRRRYWKTATLEAQCTTKAARLWWRYARGAWLYEQGAVVLCGDEKPNSQALGRRVPPQPRRSGQLERREFESTRHGTVPCRVAFNVDDGTL
jgi:hypothetical protein